MFETDVCLSLSLNFLYQKQKSHNQFQFLDKCIKSQFQSQYLILILKVSISVLEIKTGYTESQSQHAKTDFAHPCLILTFL